MKFAINYSPQAADLFQRGLISLDLFKCPPWPDLIAAARTFCPVYIHFDFHTTARLQEKLEAVNTEQFCADTRTPYVNLHLDSFPEDFPGMALDTTDPHDTARIADALLDGTRLLVERFGAERVIVENVPYHGLEGKVIRPCIEPAVIRRVVEETGCGLLLDISHARLSARSIGVDEQFYLAQMPGERLSELHVTGIGPNREGQLRDHMALTGEDWPFVEWVLERVRGGEWAQPAVMAFEYGGIGPHFDWRSDPAVIAAQVPRLYALAHA